MPFLWAEAVENIMTDTPEDNRCMQFADYVLRGYIAPTSTYPPSMWASIPEENSKRTNNGPEAFHSKFNTQFYTSHPNIFLFLDIIKQIQTTYIKIRALDSEALVRRVEAEKVRYCIQKYSDYVSGAVSRQHYISTLGYKYSAVTDMWIFLLTIISVLIQF